MVPANPLGRMALSGYGGEGILHSPESANESKQNKIKQDLFPTQKSFSFPNFPHQTGQLIQNTASLPVSGHCFTRSCGTVMMHSDVAVICPLNLKQSFKFFNFGFFVFFFLKSLPNALKWG